MALGDASDLSHGVTCRRISPRQLELESWTWHQLTSQEVDGSCIRAKELHRSGGARVGGRLRRFAGCTSVARNVETKIRFVFFLTLLKVLLHPHHHRQLPIGVRPGGGGERMFLLQLRTTHRRTVSSHPSVPGAAGWVAEAARLLWLTSFNGSGKRAGQSRGRSAMLQPTTTFSVCDGPAAMGK